MHRALTSAPGIAASIAIAILCGCGNPTTPTPPLPAVPTIAGIDVVGPDSIPPGESAQYSALIRLSNGERKAPASPDYIRWSTGTLLSISSTGLATATDRVGASGVIATLVMPGVNPAAGSKIVYIVPKGTYRLAGRVLDAANSAITIPGARIEVTPGDLVTTTSPFGQYLFFGVPADAEFRITRAGYEPLVERIQLSTHGNRDFRMTVSGERLQLSGSYWFDIETTCTALPVELRNRRYEASLTMSGTQVRVTLTEPRFSLDIEGNGNWFEGLVDTFGANFDLRQYIDFTDGSFRLFQYPSVAERLADGKHLVPSGVSRALGSADSLTGRLGELTLYDAGFQSIGDCSSANSQINYRLTRR